mgnify:CR=1 FL=1
MFYPLPHHCNRSDGTPDCSSHLTDFRAALTAVKRVLREHEPIHRGRWCPEEQVSATVALQPPTSNRDVLPAIELVDALPAAALPDFTAYLAALQARAAYGCRVRVEAVA